MLKRFRPKMEKVFRESFDCGKEKAFNIVKVNGKLCSSDVWTGNGRCIESKKPSKGDLVAIYHTHPTIMSVSKPSEADVKDARRLGAQFTVIGSKLEGIRAWRVKDLAEVSV